MSDSFSMHVFKDALSRSAWEASGAGGLRGGHELFLRGFQNSRGFSTLFVLLAPRRADDGPLQLGGQCKDSFRKVFEPDEESARQSVGHLV